MPGALDEPVDVNKYICSGANSDHKFDFYAFASVGVLRGQDKPVNVKGLSSRVSHAAILEGTLLEGTLREGKPPRGYPPGRFPQALESSRGACLGVSTESSESEESTRGVLSWRAPSWRAPCWRVPSWRIHSWRVALQEGAIPSWLSPQFK